MVDFVFCCAFLPGESSVGGIHVDAFLGFSNACESAGQLDSSGQSMTKLHLNNCKKFFFEEYSVLIPGDSSDLPGNLPGYHASFQRC